MVTDENIMNTELLAMNVSQGTQLPGFRLGLASTNACDSDSLPPRLVFSYFCHVIKALDVPRSQGPFPVLDIPI